MINTGISLKLGIGKFREQAESLLSYGATESPSIVISKIPVSLVDRIVEELTN
jgi:hypothetical protein